MEKRVLFLGSVSLEGYIETHSKFNTKILFL
jgi:hypothetical protein